MFLLFLEALYKHLDAYPVQSSSEDDGKESKGGEDNADGLGKGGEDSTDGFGKAGENSKDNKDNKDDKEGEPSLAIGARATLWGTAAGSCGLRPKAKRKGKGTSKGKRVIGAKDTTPTSKHQTQAQHTNHRLTRTQPTPPRGLRR